MPSLKNMMNVQVKLEPLPQSILQQPHGTINLASGSAPNLLPFLQPPTVKAEQYKVEQSKPRTQEKRPKKTESHMPSAVQKEDIKPNFQMEMKHEPMEYKEPLRSIPTFPTMPGQPTIPGQPTMPVRKKRDRFGGMTEEEVLKRFLPDHFTYGLDIAFVGINPGLLSAYVGHHYPSPSNHFWKCLYLSGLIPKPMKAVDDYKLLEMGIGFTNIVERTSRGSADLSRKEIRAGGEVLKEKIRKYKPKIVVFNGKGIFEVFCGHKNFSFGKQPVHFPGCNDTLMFVMPSSSARCTQLPRAADKVPFYVALKKLRDYLRGDIKNLYDSEVTFPDIPLKTAPSIEAKVEEKIDGKPPTKKLRKKAEKVKLSNQQHDMIQQAVHQVKQEDGPFMPPPPISAGGQMPGMFPPPPNQPQMMQPLQNQHQQPVSSAPNTGPMGGGGFSMPPHSSWGNMNPGTMGGQGSPRQQGSSGMGQDFYSQHWAGAPQPPHSHPASQQTPQQQQQPPAMTPSWSAGAPPMPGGSSWMPPHQQYMKPPMHGGQPPPYPYGGQYGTGGPNPQGQPFPYPGFSPHLMHNSRDQNSGMYDPKVKDESRWPNPH